MHAHGVAQLLVQLGARLLRLRQRGRHLLRQLLAARFALDPLLVQSKGHAAAAQHQDQHGHRQGHRHLPPLALFRCPNQRRRTSHLGLLQAFLHPGQISRDRRGHRPGVAQAGLRVGQPGSAGPAESIRAPPRRRPGGRRRLPGRP